MRLCHGRFSKSYAYPPFDPGPIDGDFGPLTDAAVREFQSNNFDFDGNPLKVDGIVGEMTWAALRSCWVCLSLNTHSGWLPT